MLRVVDDPSIYASTDVLDEASIELVGDGRLIGMDKVVRVDREWGVFERAGMIGLCCMLILSVLEDELFNDGQRHGEMNEKTGVEGSIMGFNTLAPFIIPNGRAKVFRRKSSPGETD
jgi:hypothetical protein